MFPIGVCVSVVVLVRVFLYVGLCSNNIILNTNIQSGPLTFYTRLPDVDGPLTFFVKPLTVIITVCIVYYTCIFFYLYYR